MPQSQPLFSLGHIVGTPTALARLVSVGLSPTNLINRHVIGDWGDDLDEGDKALNDAAVEGGDRILSSYTTPAGKVWVLTEHDRSVTTVLLPSEY